MAEKVDGMLESTNAQASVPGSAAEALQKHEAAKMSRRAVLSKVGLKFGAAALLAFSVDDLARKVTATIAARNKDSEVAQAVAREFKNAGVAFADDESYGPCQNCGACTRTKGRDCKNCGSPCTGQKAASHCEDTPCSGSCWAAWIREFDGSGQSGPDRCKAQCDAHCSGSSTVCINNCEGLV